MSDIHSSTQRPSIAIPIPVTRHSFLDHDQGDVQPSNQPNTPLRSAIRRAQSSLRQLLQILAQADNAHGRNGLPAAGTIPYTSLQEYLRVRDERRERKVVRIIKDTNMSSRARARLYPRAFEIDGILRRQCWYLKDSGRLTDEEWRSVAPRRRSARLRR